MEKAQRYLLKALDSAPQDPSIVDILTLLWIKTKGKAGAIKELEGLIKTHPKNPSLYGALGKLQLIGKDYDDAEKALKKAIELSPESPRFYTLLSSVYAASGNTKKALGELKKALAKKPDSAYLHTMVAMLYDREGNFKKAMEHYRRAIDIRPDFVPALNNLAWLIAQTGEDLSEALGLAMKAKEKAPKDPFVADTLGWVHFKRGSYDLALPQFQEAATRLKRHPAIQYHLALDLEKLKRFEDARKVLKDLLKEKKQLDLPERGDAETLLRKINTKINAKKGD